MRLKVFLIGSQILTVVLSICMLGMVNFYYTYQSVKNEVYYKNEIIAQAIARHVAEILENPVRMLEQIRTMYLAGDKAGQEYLDKAVGQMIAKESFFESIEILDARGRVTRIIPHNEDVLDIDHSRHEFYSKIKEGAPIYWSNSFVSLETGRPTVILAMPLAEGILVGYINLQRIGDLAAAFSQSYGKDVLVAVTDAKGIIVAHSDQDKVWQREWSRDLLQLHNQQRQYGYTVSSGAGEYLVSIQDVPKLGWHIIVYQGAEMALAVLRRMTLFYVITAILVLAAGIAFSWHKIGDVIGALTQLNQRLMKIASGDFSGKAGQGQFTELNEVASHFNHMVNSIRERDEQLQELACRDALTGLGNRTCFLQWLYEAARGTEPFAIVFLDLDNFKMINDKYGHWRGDQVLQVVAQRLEAAAAATDGLARIGGDEFVCLVRNWQTAKGQAWLKQLRRNMEIPVEIGSFVFYAECSIGIACFPDDSRDADELLRFADLAMYQVKNRGKNNYRFYSADMYEMLKRKTDIMEALKSPELYQELFVVYQPVLTADGKSLRGFEALLRWKSHTLGMVTPAEFIPIAEELGVISGIGHWVLQEACGWLASLQEGCWKNCIISINVSALQLRNVSFIRDISETLANAGIPARQLELEITESAIIGSLGEAAEILLKLKSLGLQIAIDDFGTGYSSLSYLHSLPIDTLKIDRAFVADVLKNHKAKAMLNGIVLLAKQMGLSVIAEGIETAEQAELVKHTGCDYCQGYLFHKPMEQDAAAAYFHRF